MSAFDSGHSIMLHFKALAVVKRTCRVALHMSAFDPKADITDPFQCRYPSRYDPPQKGVSVRRREFVTLVASAMTWPLAARAQQPGRIWRIGFLAGGTRPTNLEGTTYGEFLRGMRELGYAENKDFIVEWRFAEGRLELLT